jgi:hypothetical protein
MALLTKIAARSVLDRIRSGLGNSVILRGSDYNDIVDAVNDLDTRVDDLEDGVYTIDTLSTDTISEATAAAGVTIDSLLVKDGGIVAGDGTVGAPSVAVGSTNKGLYEVSANQLGVSVTGALATLFDTSGIKTDSVRARVEPITAGAGTVSVSTLGDGRNFTTTATLTNFVVGALPGAGANLAIGNRVFAFPAGAHLHEVTYMSVGLTGAGTANTPDVGVGSVQGAGAVNVLGGTATFEDYITGQTAADITGTATVKTSVATAGALTGISINAAASSKDVFLNVAGAWAADNTGNLTANGTITMKWVLLS